MVFLKTSTAAFFSDNGVRHGRTVDEHMEAWLNPEFLKV